MIWQMATMQLGLFEVCTIAAHRTWTSCTYVQFAHICISSTSAMGRSLNAVRYVSRLNWAFVEDGHVARICCQRGAAMVRSFA